MNLTTIKIWLQAARLPSQSYIFLPLLLGQSYVYFQTHSIDLVSFFLIQGFGIANQLYIVFANDYADQEADKLNKTFTIFSGGSRVLVENKIKPSSLRNASFLMATLCILLSTASAVYTANWFLILLGMIALLLLQMYSYPPLQLSYRGGGEFLQMLGVGLILPLFGYLGQSGNLTHFPTQIILPLLLINLACAMATSLPDLPGDKLANKKTFSVSLGIRNVKTIIVLLELVAYFLFISSAMIQRMNLINACIYLIPLLLILLSLLGRKAEPGTFKLSIFVFFSISFNLSIPVLLILKNFRTIS
jgi:1,4-dihydroxy-2-naphthoate octaprenyltransferase